MFKFIWHTWFKGHSMRTNRLISIGMWDASKGWLHTCECGEQWAR